MLVLLRDLQASESEDGKMWEKVTKRRWRRDRYPKALNGSNNVGNRLLLGLLKNNVFHVIVS